MKDTKTSTAHKQIAYLNQTANRRHQKHSSEAATTDHSLHELQVQFSEKYQLEINKFELPKS